MREIYFEMISISLGLPSGHKMLVVGAYHPPKFSYKEEDLLNCVMQRVDDFLDSNPNCVVIIGGDLNQLNLELLSAMSGLIPLVHFPTRNQAILDNCLTNISELFSKLAYPMEILTETDHMGVVIPAGIKLKPLHTKVTFRDNRAHNKAKFQSKLAAQDWSKFTSSQTVDNANNLMDNII